MFISYFGRVSGLEEVTDLDKTTWKDKAEEGAGGSWVGEVSLCVLVIIVGVGEVIE